MTLETEDVSEIVKKEIVLVFIIVKIRKQLINILITEFSRRIIILSVFRGLSADFQT